jgi:hypothetical protein
MHAIAGNIDQQQLNLLANRTSDILRRLGGIDTNIMNRSIDQPIIQENKSTQPINISFINKKTRLSLDAIKLLANSIKKQIIDKGLTPPNFNNRSKINIRKIKNFIHTLTKVWLSYDEILIFTHEIL